MKRHINIPIFIPHLGCPNACVFCNQRRISGKMSFDVLAVDEELKKATKTIDYQNSEVEIAFFGGSFTGIDREQMIYLLGLAKKYIDLGKAQSVRISTRPDYIDEEILDILEEYCVTDIELGLQSFDEQVLLASKRGHSAERARQACRMIKARGFNLVGQMMLGLPSSTLESELMTAREIAALECDAARIYPTVVLCETELAEMLNDGVYTPLEMDDAIRRAKEVLEVFVSARVPVIRLGLHAAENMSDPDIVEGGAYHSALGELVYSELYYSRICKYIEEHNMREKLVGKELTIYAPCGETSKVSGQKRANKLRIQNEYNVKKIKIIEKSDLIWYNIILEIN